MTANKLVRGLLPQLNTRFAAVAAPDLVTQAARQHQCDAVSAWLLGQALLCSALLSTTIKGQEKLTLRWEYAGPVGQVTADCTANHQVRAFAQKVSLMPEVTTLEEAIGPVEEGNQARISVVTSLPSKVLQTSTTAAVFGDVPRDLGHMYSLSAQLETGLATGLHLPPNDPPAFDGAAGLLVQPLPGADLETFDTLRVALEQRDTTTWLEAEARDTNALLDWLRGHTEVEVLEEAHAELYCTCNRDKMKQMLLTLPPNELTEMAEADEASAIACHFCGRAETFNSADLSDLARQVNQGNA